MEQNIRLKAASSDNLPDRLFLNYYVRWESKSASMKRSRNKDSLYSTLSTHITKKLLLKLSVFARR